MDERKRIGHDYMGEINDSRDQIWKLIHTRTLLWTLQLWPS